MLPPSGCSPGLGWGRSIFSRGAPYRGWDLYARGELGFPPEGLDLLRDLYDGEVRLADAQVADLVTSWHASGRSGIIVVTSDHGEYFGEHGLLEHGRTAWKEVVDVPLVMVAPGLLPAGRVVDAPVQLHDVYPTLLELARLDDPAWTLADALAGVPRPGPIAAAARVDRYKLEVASVYRTAWRLYRSGGFALVTATDGSRTELYDDAADPRWTTDIAASHPEQVERLVDAAREAFPTHVATSSILPDLTDGMIEELRAMGYVGG